MKGVRCVKEAPRQGWLLQLREGRLTGIAGSGVKGGDDWLFEGGWAHTDLPRSLSPSGVYLGSGAVWDGKTLSLIAPSHTADAVYVLERPDELMASNSLPFLLAASGTYDFPIRRLTGTMLSLKRGIRSHKRCIYSGRQGKFYRFFNAIVTHTPDAGLQERLQVAEADFDSFDSYRAYLVSTIRQASDTYGSQGIAVHVSRGYDSVACAAIAASLGKGGTALCVERSRWGDPDDGTEVARMLGLDPVLLPRRDRQKVSGDYHAGEYVSANDVRDLYEFYLGMGVTDACLKAPEEVLAGRTLLTGFHGDDIWAPSMSAFPDLVRDSADGSSLGEFRLRVGYLHVPVPMLGFRRAVWLRGLSLSEEMRPWRLNRGYYDRPIPRRIAEEAGVPRELFGQVKHAAAMIAVNLSTIASEMFRALIADYEPAARAFEAKAGRRRSWLRLPGGHGMQGVRTSADVPRQAWAVKLRKGRLTGVAGVGVKKERDWLFEGGWALAKSPRSLSLGGVYLGSGAVWDGHTLSLIAPSHSADAIYMLTRRGEIFASNSLPFVLASAGISDVPLAELVEAAAVA